MPAPCNTRTHILLINRSLLTGLPFFPALFLGVSVHISFTFSNTILQCLSKAFTRARSLRLFRQEIRTCACDRTAVWRMESGPEVNSCSSSWAISNSLVEMLVVLSRGGVAGWRGSGNVRQLWTRLGKEFSVYFVRISAFIAGAWVFRTWSLLRPPFCCCFGIESDIQLFSLVFTLERSANVGGFEADIERQISSIRGNWEVKYLRDLIDTRRVRRRLNVVIACVANSMVVKSKIAIAPKKD